MLTRLFLLLSSLVPLVAQTSTVTGTVQDPMGAALSGARVSLDSKSAATDPEGRFRVEGVTNGTATLKVEADGFRTFVKTLEIVGDRDEQIHLELAVLSESVLVTASGGTAIALEEAGISATVFTDKDMKTKQFNRVADMLRDVPGLNIVQTGSNGGITGLFARGGESNAVVVMLDGVPVTDPGGSINLTGLSTPGLERMEVVRGPQSSLYGAEAASGVIQMFTKRGDPESTRPHGEVMYERGSFSTDHWTAGLNGGFLGRGDYSMTADQFRSTGQFPNNVFRSTTGTGNIGYRISNNTSVRGVYRQFDSYTGTPGATAWTAYNLDGHQADRDSVVGVRLEDTRSDWFSHRANFGYHRLRSRYEDFSPESYNLSALVRDQPGNAVFFVRLAPPGSIPDPGTRLVSQTIDTFPASSLSITDRTSGGYQATMMHRGGTFVAGYDFERQAGLITGNNVDRRNNGLSLFDQYSWRDRIFFSVGARVEHSNVFGYRFAPRGAVTFKLPTNTFLRLSLGRGIKQPALIENFALTSSYVGNRNLHPAKTDTFEAGLTRDWWGSRVRTEVAYFRNRYFDLIQFVSGPAPLFIGTWQNVAKSRSRGIELTGSVKITSMITARGGYTRLNSRILESPTASDIGQSLLRRPNNSGTASIELNHRRFTAILGARFVGASRNNTFAGFGVNRISAYNPVYLSINVQASKRVGLFMRINNLTDQTYQEVSGYGAWSGNALGGIRLTY